MKLRRILGVKLADLGDLLTVTPALQALKGAHPDAEIDLLVPPSSARLLEGASYINKVVTFDKFAFDSLGGLLDVRRVVGTLLFLRELRGEGYDALAVFHHFTSRWGAVKFGLLCAASGAGVKAGLDNGHGRFLTARVKDEGFGARHEADYWLEVAGLLGADVEGGWRSDVPIGEGERAEGERIIGELRGRHGGRVVAMHPGAGGYSLARIWGEEKFGAVARGLIRDGAAVIVVGGPDDRERGERVVEAVGGGEGDGVVNLAGRTSIGETAAVLAGCDLFVGNDSGPMHLAAAVGVPVVAVFGPSNAEAWGPYTPRGERVRHSIVRLGLPCQPCFYRGHSLGLREGCGPRPCLGELGPERVLEECRRVMTGYRGESKGVE